MLWSCFDLGLGLGWLLATTLPDGYICRSVRNHLLNGRNEPWNAFRAQTGRKVSRVPRNCRGLDGSCTTPTGIPDHYGKVLKDAFSGITVAVLVKRGNQRAKFKLRAGFASCSFRAWSKRSWARVRIRLFSRGVAPLLRLREGSEKKFPDRFVL